MLPEPLAPPHLCPGMSFNLGKLELRVVGVHLSDLFPGWCSQHLEREGGRGVSQSPYSSASLPPPAHSPPRRALTLMISTSWSTPLSPGKMGWPRRSSASTQPADHTSEGECGEGQGCPTHPLTNTSLPRTHPEGARREPHFLGPERKHPLQVPHSLGTREPAAECPGLPDCTALSDPSVCRLPCLSPLSDPRKPLLCL